MSDELPPGASAPLPKGLSVVVPCYRSAGSIGLLVEQLRPVLVAHGAPWEIVLVDDGSPDDTGAVIAALARSHPEVRAIALMRNYGQHAALLCGIRAARFDVTITMDDDLQHPPDQLPRLLAGLTDAFDVVYGPAEREPHGLWRALSSRITKRVLEGAMGPTARKVSALRAFRTSLRDGFASFGGSFVSIDVMLTWATNRFTFVTVRHEPRTIGASGYTVRKLFTHAANMLTGFSTIPLQLASMVGFALTGFGVVILAYVLGRYAISGSSVPGFPFLAAIISIFSGAQLLCLGIIGAYLGRAHFRLLDRPAYVVRSTGGGAPTTSAPPG